MKRLPFTLAAMLFLAACETVPLAHAVDPLLKGGDKNDDSDWTLNAALETLVAAMQDNDSQAAAALGLLGDPRAVDPLLKEAEKNDGYDWTLNAALQSLGQLGDPRAVPVLAARLDDKRTNPAACYRCRIAADALAALGDPGLEALLQRLNDTPDRVRTAVASALGKQKNMRAVPALLSALDEASGGMYRLKRAFFISIVVSLGQLGDERAVEPLIRFLDISAGGKNYHSLSHSEDLAIPMIRALGQIGD